MLEERSTQAYITQSCTWFPVQGKMMMMMMMVTRRNKEVQGIRAETFSALSVHFFESFFFSTNWKCKLANLL